MNIKRERLFFENLAMINNKIRKKHEYKLMI